MLVDDHRIGEQVLISSLFFTWSFGGLCFAFLLLLFFKKKTSPWKRYSNFDPIFKVFRSRFLGFDPILAWRLIYASVEK